jgi:hypothetical protein
VPQQDVRIAVLLPERGSAQVADVEGGWWTVVREQVVFAIVGLGVLCREIQCNGNRSCIATRFGFLELGRNVSIYEL